MGVDNSGVNSPASSSTPYGSGSVPSTPRNISTPGAATPDGSHVTPTPKESGRYRFVHSSPSARPPPGSGSGTGREGGSSSGQPMTPAIHLVVVDEVDGLGGMHNNSTMQVSRGGYYMSMTRPMNEARLYVLW